MNTRAHGPLAGFHWLRRALQVGRHNPRALFGGAAMLMAAWLAPSMLQAILHLALDPGDEVAIAIAALMTLLSVLILAPMMGGYLRLIDASEHGRPAHARDVFQLFHSRHAWRTCAGFGLLLMLVHLAVGYVLVSQFASGLLDWYLEVTRLLQQVRPGDAGQPQLPAPPAGIGGFLGLASIFALFIGGVFAVGLGQVAMGGRGVRAAFADGFAGAAKNLLPLLVLAVLAFGAMVVAVVAVFMVLVVVGGLAGLLHPVLATLVVVPLYLGFLAVLNAIMFSVMYQVWRDVTDQAPGAPAVPAVPGNLEA